MTEYTAPIEDIKFVMEDLLDIHKHYQKYPDYQEVTPDVVDMVLTECAKFCETELAPLNQSGDKEGCQWQDGKVTTPKGFKEAYKIILMAAGREYRILLNMMVRACPILLV